MTPRPRRLLPNLLSAAAHIALAGCLTHCAALPVPSLESSPSPLPSATLTWTPQPPTVTPGAGPSSTLAPALDPGVPPRVADPVWVANETDGNLLLIDPADNSVAVIIPTNLNPRWVTAGEGSVWALDAQHDVLIQVDPETYTLVRVIPFPERDVNALSAGAGAVWVAYTERAGLLFLLPHEEYTPVGGIARVDPASGKITGDAQTGPVVALAVQPAPAFLWALGRGPVDTPILRVDPQSLAFQSIALSGSSDWPLEDAFALTADGLWLYSSAFGKLYRAAPDGRLYSEISLGRQKPLAPPALLPMEGDIWLALPWPALLRVDPGQQRVIAEIALDTPAEHLVFAGGAVWAVSPLGGRVYRIDPVQNTVVAAIPIGARAQPTPRVSPTPILRASLPCEEAPYSRLAIGMRAATPREPAIPNRVHTEAGKETDLTGYILPGQSVVILDGPACMDNWVWWKIRNEINFVEGWVAEGDELEYWLIPLK